MKQFYCILSFSYFLLLSSNGNSQPTITSSLNPTDGFSFQAYTMNPTSVSEGNSGANQTWNFSGLTNYTATYDYLYYDASKTPYASNFPSANLAVTISSSPGLYVYQDANSQFIESIGYESSQYSLYYTDPYVALQYPFTYGDSFTDTYAHDYGSGTITVTADAYGTIKLPYGTFNNVLRIKTIDVGYYSTLTTYSFYSENSIGAPLMTISYSNNITTVYVYYGVISGTVTSVSELPFVKSESSEGVYVSVNPSYKEVSFTIGSHQSYSIQLTDMQGKTIYAVPEQFYYSGKNILDLSNTYVPKGMYIISFISKNNLISKKIIF